jgi:Protein of unknown function (DUF3604)
MRRSICYVEPSTAQAGEVNTWKFTYTSAVSLPKGTRLKFDLLSKGRNIDWEIPSVNLKKPGNIIFAQLENGKIIQGKEIEVPDSFTPLFEFLLPESLEAGANFIIVVGSAKPGKGSSQANGTTAQCHAQRRKPFNLFLDTSGKGRYEDPEVFNIDIRGNKLKFIRVLTPSFVTRNKRFDVIVRFEDEFGNLTNEAPEDTLIELSYENLRENLNWKLFVPETGFIALPNLYFNEPGVYTIKLLNTLTKEVFRSPPIMCFPENNKHLYWGLLHGESERIDSTENIESCLRHFRDEKAYNFIATSPFESQEETSNDTWKMISQNVVEFDESDRFTTFLGFQWDGIPLEEGLRQIIHSKEARPILRKKDAKYSTLKKIYKSFSPKEIISIPTFTMGKGYEYNFNDFQPEFERVVEIYNSWGSSEVTKKEGNVTPIASSDKSGIQESAEGSIQKALLKNCRFGFVAGGLDDRGIYANFFEGGQEQYPPGLTAIIAPEHSRQALFDALYNRSCYATTGERIIVGLSLASTPMGGEISTADKPGLKINRHLSGYVAGTTTLKSVELIRNGKVITTFETDRYSLNFTYDDMAPLEKVTHDAKDKKPAFIYYYLRVTQIDGHMAWSSPIWVDYIPGVPLKRPPKPLAKLTKKPFLIEEEVEEEEEEDDFEDVDDDDEDEE